MKTRSLNFDELLLIFAAAVIAEGLLLACKKYANF